jgi:hypothetical protein
MDCVVSLNYQVNMHHLVLLTAKLANLKTLSSFAKLNWFDVLCYTKILTRRTTDVLCCPEVWCCHRNAYEYRGILTCVARMYCLHLHSIYQSVWHHIPEDVYRAIILDSYWLSLPVSLCVALM